MSVGQVSEWFKEHDWNSCGCNSLVGSNPTLSVLGNEESARSDSDVCYRALPIPFCLKQFDRAKRGDSGALYLQSALAELNSLAPARVCGAARRTER